MSTIKVDTLVAADGSSAVTLTKQVAAKMWVNYNQTNHTARDSFNLSSLTDVSQGNSTINITNAMGNANYAPTGSVADTGSGAGNRFAMFGSNYDSGTLDANFTTTSFSENTMYGNSSASEYDSQYILIAVHGDLA